MAKQTAKQRLLENVKATFDAAKIMDERLFTLYQNHKVTSHMWRMFNWHDCGYGQSLWKKWLNSRNVTASSIGITFRLFVEKRAKIESFVLENELASYETCQRTLANLSIQTWDEIKTELIDGGFIVDDRRQMSTLKPAFTTFTDFTPGKHLQCPVCGFETIYTDARRRAVSYVIADGLTVDAATTERDATVKQSDFTGISCNRIGCDWVMPAETLTADDIRGIDAWVSSRMATIPAGYETAAFFETGHYRHHVAMSDAFADRTDVAGAEHCRCFMIAAAESLQRLQSWAADPAAYDFSELAGVTA